MKTRIVVFAWLLLLSTGTSGDLVYRVPIHKTIDLGLPPFIERAIEEAEAQDAVVIVFDIDTFGGRVDGATRIKDAILASRVETVAYINRRAISAGALISLACEKIYMTKGATIGATTVVDLSGKKGSEKVISYMREEMASTAAARGRNVELAKGMVDEELSFTHLVIDSDSVEVTDVEGSKEGKLVTLRTETALKYKIADGKTETFDELLEILGLSDAVVVDLQVSWSEKLVRFLTEPVVSSLLMTLGFLGLFFELQSPGWGVPGTVGLICLALFFGATLFTNLAEWTELLIILIGVVLVLIEVLLIPGFGVVGITGGLIILAGFFMILLPTHPLYVDYKNALWGLVIGIFGALVGLFFMGRALTRTRFWQKITMPISERSAEGYSTSIGVENLVGSTGVAVTNLRPAGWVTIGDQRVFVVSEGDYIANGDAIKILSVDGNRVVVRKISSSK